MGVAFGSIVNASGASSATLGPSPSITTPADNPVVLVFVATNHPTAVVDSLTITGFGGTAAHVASIRDAANVYCAIWKITAPTPNTAGTVQANLSAGVTASRLAVAAYSGAHQTDPSPSADAKTSASVTTPETLTPDNLTANDMTAGLEADNNVGNIIAAVSPTSRYYTGTNQDMGVGDASGTTGVTLSKPGSATSYSKVAARIVSAPVAILIVGDRAIDVGLSALDAEADKIYVCSAQPTTFTEATSTFALGNKDFGAGAVFGSPAAGSPGRTVTSNAVTDGSVTGNGTVLAWAIVDSANSRLLASGPLTGGVAVTSGQVFTLGAITIRMPGTLS